MAITAAQSRILCSNLVWRLPDLKITRPEGRLEAVHEADERTGDYYFLIDSTIDVRALRPLLEPGQQKGLDYFTFSEPPALEAEIRGNWHDLRRIRQRSPNHLPIYQPLSANHQSPAPARDAANERGRPWRRLPRAEDLCHQWLQHDRTHGGGARHR